MVKIVIEDSVSKFSAYVSLITSDYDLARAKVGDRILSDEFFYKNLILEMYTAILSYSLDWFDDSDLLREDAPFTNENLSNVIDNGNELIKSIITLPLNY